MTSSSDLKAISIPPSEGEIIYVDQIMQYCFTENHE